VKMSDLVPHLADLADKINAEHQQAETALRAGLEHAKNAGELLLQAKGQCRHGQWLPWLAANVRCSERTAQAYMRIVKRWPELEAKAQGLADLTFGDGLKLLAAPKDYDYDATVAEAVALLQEVEAAFPFSGPYTVAELRTIIDLAEEARRLAHVIKIDNMTFLGEVLMARSKK